MKITRRKFLYLSGLVSTIGVVGRFRAVPRFASYALPGASDTHATIELSPADLAAGRLENVVLVDGELRLATGVEGTCQSPVIEAPFEFSSLGSYWKAGGGETSASVRVSVDGVAWQDWQSIPVEPAERDEPGPTVYGSLRGGFPLPLPRFVQFELALHVARAGTLPSIRSLTIAFINTTRGPTTDQALASAAVSTETGTTDPSRPTIISRAAWGCPDGQTSSNWWPEYQTATHLFIHHTDTSNGVLDWAAIVRAIWHYHSIDLGWGDIGYHFLVDPNGYLYEGRAGGDDVIAGHTYGFNRGTVGLAFLGTYSTDTAPSAMVSAAEALIAWKAAQRGIDVTTSGTYVSYPNCSNETVFIPHLLGHRDAPGHGSYDACNSYGPTSCPGDRLWGLLPTLRSEVANVPVVTMNEVSTSKTWFVLSWRGEGGTGSLIYSVSVSTDGVTWRRWIGTAKTSALFVGSAQRTYYFVCTATDSLRRSGTSPRLTVRTGSDSSGLQAERLGNLSVRL